MSMHVCPQTLVLVDNDLSVSSVNQKLIKSTLKYMFYHAPSDRTFCLATYGHDTEKAEEFTGNINDLVCDADKMEFTDKDSNIYDTLTEVITRWKESDFACRDIVVFTDGLEGVAENHEKEELYYLIENSEYPVYVVFANQENNQDARKGLAAVSVTSGGKITDTEFEGSDGAVDRQITEKIFAAMDEYTQVHWAKYEETTGEEETLPGDEDNTEEEGKEQTDVEEEILPEEYAGSYSTEPRVVYEYNKEQGTFEGTKTLVLSALLIAAGLLAGILGGLVIMKRRRAAAAAIPVKAGDDEELFDDYDLKGLTTSDLSTYEDCATVMLDDEYDRPTRLLDDNAVLVTLSDKEDGMRRFAIALKGTMSIGRSNTDVVITGDDALSKRHCELSEEGGKVFVSDLSSSNGTKVNGRKIVKEELFDDDELSIGSRTYGVKIG